MPGELDRRFDDANAHAVVSKIPALFRRVFKSAATRTQKCPLARFDRLAAPGTWQSTKLIIRLG
jgi:hypothetical protein